MLVAETAEVMAGTAISPMRNVFAAVVFVADGSATVDTNTRKVVATDPVAATLATEKNRTFSRYEPDAPAVNTSVICVAAAPAVDDPSFLTTAFVVGIATLPRFGVWVNLGAAIVVGWLS